VILDVLQLIAGPLALSSANRGGERDATTGKEVVETLRDDVDLVLDDGPTRYGQPSSVVHVAGRECRILRVGVVPERTIRRLSSYMVLFVCTGNTCRSPMAEVLFRKILADRLTCRLDELEERGVIVLSAGVSAMSGGRASSEAVHVLAEMGLDLSQHETQPLNDSLVRQADAIFTMTQSHRHAILAQWPDAAARTHTLGPSGEDIVDPIGGPLDRYLRCARQIGGHLERRIDEIIGEIQG